MQYFTESFFVTIIGFILAFVWGNHENTGSGLMAVFIVFVLSVLEISLSFDNAVVNATKLKKMSEKWRKRFLTWGILIAVFGMRFLFPVLVVSLFAKISLLQVVNIAFTNSMKYAYYLHQTHAPIVAFGGTFLLMLFFSYFFNDKKDVHWIKFFEQHMQNFGKIKGAETIFTVIALCVTQHFVAPHHKLEVLLSGLIGIVLYLLVDGITHWLETREAVTLENLSKTCKDTGIIGFLYLELIDASFSLDGVLGAFALSKDIVIITLGLGIGAMFVRSLTIMLVEKNTLDKFLYLEHGAHWAIGALGAIMLVTTFREVPEVVTGLTGLVFILLALASSFVYNRKSKSERG